MPAKSADGDRFDPRQDGIIALEKRSGSPSIESERLMLIRKNMMGGEEIKELFRSLEGDARKTAEESGNAVAGKIAELIEKSLESGEDPSGKDLCEKIHKEISLWLKNISGVSRYFLLQETKRISEHLIGIAKLSS